MQQHKLPVDGAPEAAGAWYQQPVLWLGVAILVASLAGCVWMITLGVRHADPPLDDSHPHTVLDMPVHAHELPPPAKATRSPGHRP